MSNSTYVSKVRCAARRVRILQSFALARPTTKRNVFKNNTFSLVGNLAAAFPVTAYARVRRIMDNNRGKRTAYHHDIFITCIPRIPPVRVTIVIGFYTFFVIYVFIDRVRIIIVSCVVKQTMAVIHVLPYTPINVYRFHQRDIKQQSTYYRSTSCKITPVSGRDSRSVRCVSFCTNIVILGIARRTSEVSSRRVDYLPLRQCTVT